MTRKITIFNDVALSTVFRSLSRPNQFYVKVVRKSHLYNAINLNNGEMTLFPASEKVEVYK